MSDEEQAPRLLRREDLTTEQQAHLDAANAEQARRPEESEAEWFGRIADVHGLAELGDNDRDWSEVDDWTRALRAMNVEMALRRGNPNIKVVGLDTANPEGLPE